MEKPGHHATGRLASIPNRLSPKAFTMACENIGVDMKATEIVKKNASPLGPWPCSPVRPSLKRLLDDIEAGGIESVVVCKVEKPFAKIQAYIPTQQLVRRFSYG